MIGVIPPQGAAHPIFDDMDDLDAIEVFYTYRPGEALNWEREDRVVIFNLWER